MKRRERCRREERAEGRKGREGREDGEKGESKERSRRRGRRDTLQKKLKIFNSLTNVIISRKYLPIKKLGSGNVWQICMYNSLSSLCLEL